MRAPHTQADLRAGLSRSELRFADEPKPLQRPAAPVPAAGAPVPPAISLLISVWPHKNPLPPIAFHTPVGKRNQGWYSYSFYIPGLDFKLAIGREIPPVLRQMSAFALPERYIYSSVAAATEMMQSFGKVVHKSVAIGKLATEYQQEMKLCEGSRCQVTKKNFPFSAKTCLTR